MDEGLADYYLVSPFGRVIWDLKKRATTDSRIKVSIYSDTRLHPYLTAVEGSELAVPTLSVIYGETVPVVRGSRADPPTPPICAPTPRTTLGPFAAPKGVVNILFFDGTTPKTIGTFQFQVVPLYTGMFAVGAGVSTLASPTYEKVFNGTDTVVSVRDAHRRMLYTATYTHFIWGKRDLTQVPQRILEHVNPFIGVVLNDVLNNVLGGVTIEARPGIGVIVGEHLGRIKRLDASSGAAIGLPFENRAESIPTDMRWVAKPYYGVFIDVHAARVLFKSVLGSSL